MFGRPIFVESTEDARDERRRNEFLRQFLRSQNHGAPLRDPGNVQSPRNDGLTLDMSFILFDNPDKVQPIINDAYFRAHQTNASNKHLLEYIRQMEERYVAMENELMRMKMLVPVMTRASIPVNQMAQTERNWLERSLGKGYGHLFGTSSENRRKIHNSCAIRNQEEITSRRKHNARKNEEPSNRILNNLECQYQEKQLPSNNKLAMEACQSIEKKHEPEACSRIDADVKHEDHTDSTLNASKSRLTPESEIERNIFEARPEVEQSLDNQRSSPREERTRRVDVFENRDNRRKENAQGNRGQWYNHLKKAPYERARAANDSSRSFRRASQRNVRPQKRVPTPRSNVHTACTPMLQSPMASTGLDLNESTIQLLRLAVLLYAPALMPALNALIARQSDQMLNSMPGLEGSNDLLTQVFRILNNQRCVPNLSYAPSHRPAEDSRSRRESNSRDSWTNSETDTQKLQKQIQEDSDGGSVSNRPDTTSIAIETSLESCTRNNEQISTTQYNK